MPEIIKLKEDVYKVKVDSNIYIVLYDNSSKGVLIDCGNREYSKFIFENIERIISPDKITDILFTHLHYDHIGNIDLFQNANIYASNEEIGFLKKDDFGTVLNSSILDILKRNRIKLKSIDKGKKIIEKLNIEIINTPGHTVGSICFYFKDKNILFTGDTYFGNGIVGRTDLPSSVQGKMKTSLDTINKFMDKKKKETKDFLVCFGHDY